MSDQGYNFDKFTNKYMVEGIIKTVTAIHVGAGENSFKPMTVNNIIVRDNEDNPYIPGSSLKGVLRSYLERILSIPGIIGVNYKKDVCSLNPPCIDEIRLGSKKTDYENKKKKGGLEFLKFLEENTCVVCQLFGSGDSSSKVLFRDMKVDKSTYSNIEIRSGVGIDRGLNISKKGALFEIETVPPKTEFHFYMVADNIKPHEWKCLLLILSAMLKGDIELGGMKSRGLGHIELVEEKSFVKKIDSDNFIDYLTDSESINKKPLIDEINEIIKFKKEA